LKTLLQLFSGLTFWLALLGVCFISVPAPKFILAKEGQALTKKWKKISLSKMNLRVIDGDTFDADLDRNGLFSNPEERIRLLYVDTPELSKSHKGKDPKYGLPAKAFLKSALSKGKAV
jgi:endonuclease YncB( thermonuclease family)